MENKRFIELKKTPIILSIIFGIVLYLLLLKYFNINPDITDIKYRDFYLKYTMISPIIFGFLSLILIYLLILIKFILRLNFLIVTIFIYLIIYGFFLFLGIDFMFLESRIAPFASLIINTFSVPLIVSSSIIILLSVFMSLKKVKSEN